MEDHIHTNKIKPLTIALALTLTFFFVEAIGGFLLGSLALIADAAHMLTDVTALLVAVVAIKIAQKPANKIKTYGYYRFEILAAAFNASLLFILAFFILYEAYQRINNPPSLEPLYMLMIASVGLSINIISMLILRTHRDSSLNIKAAYLDVMSDMLGSMGVIVGAILIYYFKWIWVDSLIGILIGLWLLPRAWSILKESINILLEGVPYGLDIDEIRKEMSAIEGVLDIHELHVWAITSNKNSLTAHVVIDPHYDRTRLTSAMREVLKSKFNITHVTLQDETTNCLEEKDKCNIF